MAMQDFTGPHELPTVLLIDDDMVSREVMATLLSFRGFAVHTAEDGIAGLALLDQAKSSADAALPTVVLMDAQMPGLSGAGLISELRSRSSARIIAISGSAAPRDVVAATDGFLLKPFSPDDLVSFLEQYTAQPASEKPQEPDEPVIAAETLAQLRAMMSEKAVRQIFAAIVADLDKRIPALDAALASADWPEVRRIGHSIKGGCAMAGARQAARLGALLEVVSLNPKSNQLDNSQKLLADLQSARHNLQRMLEHELPA